jgi:hypothetical protein
MGFRGPEVQVLSPRPYPYKKSLSGILLKGFLLFINYFSKKEGFLIERVEYNTKLPLFLSICK